MKFEAVEEKGKTSSKYLICREANTAQTRENQIEILKIIIFRCLLIGDNFEGKFYFCVLLLTCQFWHQNCLNENHFRNIQKEFAVIWQLFWHNLTEFVKIWQHFRYYLTAFAAICQPCLLLNFFLAASV
jgi:hypothetical protein